MYENDFVPIRIAGKTMHEIKIHTPWNMDKKYGTVTRPLSLLKGRVGRI